MKKHPLIHALLATTYIALIALGMTYFSSYFEGREDTFLMPIMMLSLLTLSVAIMGYLFFYHPLQMYLDGNKKEAATFFLQTLGSFAIITAIVIIIALINIG